MLRHVLQKTVSLMNQGQTRPSTVMLMHVVASKQSAV